MRLFRSAGIADGATDAASDLAPAAEQNHADVSLAHGEL